MRDAKYWSFMSAAFFSSFGSSMYFIAVAWILYKTTSDATYTGLMVGLGFLPGVVFNLVFGVLVDNLNRKRLTVISQAIVTSSMLFLLISMVFHQQKPWLIIVVHMLVQTFSSLFRTAQQAFMTELYTKSEIPRIYSETGSATSIGGLIGTSVCGVALTLLPSWGVMVIVCVSFLISMMSMVWIKMERAVESIKGSHSMGLKDLVEGFTYVHKNPFMYSLLSIMFVGQLVVHTGAGMLSVYTSSYLHGSSKMYGFLESATSVGAIIAGFSATWFLYRSKSYISPVALFITCLGLFLLAFTRNPFFAFPAILFIGLGTTWLRVLMQSVQQISTEPAYYGRMAALRQTINQGAVTIGGPILGWVAEHYGVNWAYGSLLIPVGILLVYSLFFAKQQTYRKLILGILPSR